MEFTNAVTCEGTIEEFVYFSLAMFIATIVTTVVSWRCEQKYAGATLHKTVLE